MKKQKYQGLQKEWDKMSKELRWKACNSNLIKIKGEEKCDHEAVEVGDDDHLLGYCVKCFAKSRRE